jgi:hypothetical protein
VTKLVLGLFEFPIAAAMNADRIGRRGLAANHSSPNISIFD